MTIRVPIAAETDQFQRDARRTLKELDKVTQTTQAAVEVVQAAVDADSGVTPGTYTNATVTVDVKGRVTSASSGSGGGAALFDTVINYSFGGINFQQFDDVSFGTLGQNTIIYYDKGGSSQKVTGIVGGVEGKTICLLDVDGAHTSALLRENASSVAANRFNTAGDIGLSQLGATWLIYHASRWQLLAYF